MQKYQCSGRQYKTIQSNTNYFSLTRKNFAVEIVKRIRPGIFQTNQYPFQVQPFLGTNPFTTYMFRSLASPSSNLIIVKDDCCNHRCELLEKRSCGLGKALGRRVGELVPRIKGASSGVNSTVCERPPLVMQVQSTPTLCVI